MTKEQTKAITTQGTTAIAEYGEWTPEQMDKESKEMGTGGDFWKPPVGRSIVRFLPPRVGWPSPFVIQHQHFIRLPNVEHPIIFSCPKMHEGKVCVPCQKADKLETSGNSRDNKAAKQLRPSKRVLSNMVVDPANAEQPVSVWSFGKTVYDQLKAIKSDDENGGNFLDPVKGFNIVVNRTGTGKDDTKYTVMPARGQSQLANMEWIATQKDLRKMIRIPTVEQQERLFDGEDPRDVWGDKDDDRPARGRKREDEPSTIDADSTEGKRTAEDDLFDDEVDLD